MDLLGSLYCTAPNFRRMLDGLEKLLDLPFSGASRRGVRDQLAQEQLDYPLWRL